MPIAFETARTMHIALLIACTIAANRCYYCYLQLGVDEKRGYALVQSFMRAHPGIQAFINNAREHARYTIINHSMHTSKYV
jgi:hypothetical protein